jgi:V/A-type H+/Na+-transporting ATPase subunit C
MARLDFANARIAARRAEVLGADALRALLARPSLEARLEVLRPARIGASLRAPQEAGGAALAAAEASLRAWAAREALDLLEDVEGTRARALLAAFLALDEAAAVKAVMRGVLRGAPPDEALAAAPPSPAIAESALRAAAAATTVGAALEVLEAAGSTLAATARAALPELARRGLLPLELAADRAAFARAIEAARGPGEDAAVLSRHLADRVDARNAATLLALAGAPATADAFLPGGRRWSDAELLRLAGLPVEAARAALAAAFQVNAADLARPWSADLALERALLAPLRREARRSPLSIAVPLAYLAERRAEVRRVALVLRGAELALPGDEILDLVEA